MAFIDAINNPITREIQKDYNRAIAQKIRNRLQQLENANDKDKRRWIWELLQNASDTVNDRTVDVEIIVTEGFIEFKHNGGYFSPRNITNLVHQISSKEGEDSIGRFGTGFLTTHTLSRTVEVEGVFTENEDYYDFKVRLNRTGNTEVELVKGIEETWETFHTEKLEEEPKNIVWSSFKYINQNETVATETINDFITFIHYNLAFVPSIGQIKVVDEANGLNYSIHKKEVQTIDNLLSFVSFEVNHNNQISEKTLLLTTNNEIQAAIEIDKLNNRIIPIANNVPRLFCAFPLVGTENFTFPMVLNSRNFAPKTERDGLFLNGAAKEAQLNKQLLQQSLQLYKTTLHYLSNQKTEDLFLLAQHKNNFKDDYFDAIWYQHNIEKPIQTQLYKTPIVKNIDGNLITIEDAQFPFYITNDNLDKVIINKIWEFQSVLLPKFTPRKEDIFEWLNIIWEDCTRIYLRSIAVQIQDLRTIQHLTHHINNENINTINWLDDLIEFYIKKERLILDDYSIIPNQKAVFCSKKDLNLDSNIPEILKDVYKILGEDWRDKLLHLEIKSLVSLLKAEKKVQYSGNIITNINNKIEQERVPYEVIKDAVFKLITILPTENEGNHKYQKDLYNFSKDLFKNQIEETIEIKGLPNTVWKVANYWQLHHIARRIKGSGSIEELSNFLKKENLNEGLEWLNQFFDFLISKNSTLGRNIIDEYAIIPNQKNVFKGKEAIYLDNNIPNELKDIYLFFGENWYDDLISLKITALNNLFKDEQKVRAVHNIIQGINSKIENKGTDQKQVEQAVFALTRLLPLENELEEEQANQKYRATIYQISKNLYKDEISNTLELENLPIQTWKNSDEWLFDFVVNTIEEQKNIVTFNDFLNFSNNDETLNWLNDFFTFVVENQKTSHLMARIYPNQLGEFEFKTALFQDKNIAEAFKDILYDLENALSLEGKKGWRQILIDKKITAFKEISAKTTKDISDEINQKIPNLKTQPSSALQEVLFKLVTLVEKDNSHQRKLWEYLRAFYLDEIPQQLQIVKNTVGFDWQPCFVWCMERLIKDITTLKYVDELEEELHGNIKILDWLADFIEFIHESDDYKRLLDGEEYAVIPNQNGSFQIKNRLHADVEIDEDLKRIIKLLNPIWLDDLLENSPIFVDLPKEKDLTTIDAAVEVDRIFRTYNDEPQKSEYVQSFRILSKWMDKNEEDFIRQNMNWVNLKKAEIALSLLGSEKAKDEVFQIIESGKGAILSKIANHADITENDLKTFVDNPQKFKHLINSINNPTNHTSVTHVLHDNDKIKEKTGGLINSVDDLLDEFIKLQAETVREKQSEPKFTIRRETTGGTTDWDAVRESNELARKRIRKHLASIEENGMKIYDLSSWSKRTNTIIDNNKKNGIQIGLVTKGADNEIIYFNSSEREFLSDTKKFTELWVHSNGKVFQITLGEILKMWNVQSIKTNMFDLK
jgi:hypothetical protein